MKQFQKDEWIEKMSTVVCSEKDIHSLVSNYFIFYGYEYSASAFLKESRIDLNIPLESIRQRKAIKKAVLQGDINEAINLLNAITEKVLEDNPDVHFGLVQQHFLQLLKSRRTAELFDYAQKYLGPLVKDNIHLLPKLEILMSLLLIEDCECDQAKVELDKIEHLDNLAARVDEMLFAFFGIEKCSNLEMVLKKMLWCEKKIAGFGSDKNIGSTSNDENYSCDESRKSNDLTVSDHTRYLRRSLINIITFVYSEASLVKSPRF